MEPLRDRAAGAKFRRQHPVSPYVADFACVEAMLIVEIDGLSHDVPEQVAFDERRTAFLQQSGWRVLRVRDTDVLGDAQRELDRIKAML